jgi:hypothetical protein
MTSGTPGRSPDNGRHSLLYGALAVILILAAFLAAVLVLRRRRSATAKQRTPAYDQKKVDRRELFAQINGREIALGPLTQVRRLEIGSSPYVAISVAGDGLLLRHVVLRRDGEVFRLRNLSRKPITANGVTVPPRRRLHLVLPTDIVLNDKVKVTLETRLPTEDEPQIAPEGGRQ